MFFEDESITYIESKVLLSHSLNEKIPFKKRIMITILPFIPDFVKRAFKAAADNRFTNTFRRIFQQYLSHVFVLLIFTQIISGMVVYHGVYR